MNMMPSDLMTPAQLELANTLLGLWLGDRTDCRVDEARDAIETLDSDERLLNGKVSRRLVSVLLRMRGFDLATPAHGGNALFRKPLAPRRAHSQTAERLRGLAYARAWPERNQPIFDRLYGRKGGTE